MLFSVNVESLTGSPYRMSRSNTCFDIFPALGKDLVRFFLSGRLVRKVFQGSMYMGF
jgi:hypothetical protein